MSFNIFNKKSTINLDIFTSSINAFKYFKPKKSSYYLPKWFKECPSSITRDNPRQAHYTREDMTIKNCPGFTSLYQKGIIVPMWDQYVIKIIDGQVYINEPFGQVYSGISHAPGQTNNNFIDYHHYKFNSPWFIKEKTGVNFAFLSPDWNLKKHFFELKIVPGILEFKYNYMLNINTYINLNQDKVIKIEPDTPFAHLVPLSDKKIKINYHLEEQSYLEKNFKTDFGIFETKQFFKMKKLLEKNEEYFKSN